jgi:anti-sigma regulatory factor (Ser/Thr protein kinase)
LENAHYHGNLEVSSELREDGLSAYYDLAKVRREQPPYRDRRIDVVATFSSGEVRVVVRDEGPGFDLSCIPDPTDLSLLERPHGRGILLMRTFVDEVEFNEKGNEVTLVKRRKPS